MEKCLADIKSWMIDARLLINDDKTKVLVIVTLCRILMLKVKARTRHAYTLKPKLNSLTKNSVFLGTVSGNKLIFFLAVLRKR